MEKFSFICFSFNNWEKRKARKQQFMLHLAKREDVERVLYVEPPLVLLYLLLFPFSELKTRDNRLRWKRGLKGSAERLTDEKNLFIFTPVFLIPFGYRIRPIYTFNLYCTFLAVRRKIRRLGFPNIVLWLYHPYDYMLLEWFKDRAVSVFDWAEDWAEFFFNYPLKKIKFIAQTQEEIIKRADIVFTVSRYLQERAKKFNTNAHRVLDGTVPEMFMVHDANIPEELKYIPRPILGFAGTIYHRFDTSLVAVLSERFPQCSIVLIGNTLLPKEEMDIVRQKKNVFCLGAKHYAELGRYMVHFDVCLLPYLSASVKAIPTKIFDYLATGKPVVSMMAPEIEDLRPMIRFAESREQFCDFVAESLREDDPRLKQLRITKAMENSWEKRAQEIMEIIRDVLRKRAGI